MPAALYALLFPFGCAGPPANDAAAALKYRAAVSDARPARRRGETLKGAPGLEPHSGDAAPRERLRMRSSHNHCIRHVGSTQRRAPSADRGTPLQGDLISPRPCPPIHGRNTHHGVAGGWGRKLTAVPFWVCRPIRYRCSGGPKVPGRFLCASSQATRGDTEGCPRP